MPCGAPPSATRAVVGDRPSGPLPRHSAAPKRSTSLHAPRASTRASAVVAAVDDDAPVAGTVRTRWWNCVSIAARSAKDVGVVELEVVEDRRARPVVDELRALVEERRVVLVGLDHEERAVASAAPTRRSRRGTPPIRKPGSRPASLEDVREHRRGRRLAVRAGDREHPLVRAAPARRATAAPTCSAGRDRGSPPSADCRARRRCRRRTRRQSLRDAVELRRVEALGQRDAERLELRATSADRRSRRSR